MGRNTRCAAAAALLALLAAGCTSLSDGEFLSQLGDPAKARVVTEEGIALYLSCGSGSAGSRP